jgi:hypothetical protein
VKKPNTMIPQVQHLGKKEDNPLTIAKGTQSNQIKQRGCTQSVVLEIGTKYNTCALCECANHAIEIEQEPRE